ncbi:MAG: hypothetical protein ACKOCB_12420 [Planctomycetia bacterium]
MLIFDGDGSPPEQRGMPFPTIRYALTVPIKRRHGGVLLHALPCASLPIPLVAAAHGLKQVVWSTTYEEIDDYVYREFGEAGWGWCPTCQGSDAD